ncbi:ABC-type branched-chain amino acid transport system, ATPase component [Frankia canadensis]|uniref:ABC-type branched-chain amino acid transport system, ATPase component n=1 Tax=Frankia canadensis TaxID=1836972 RepID=A0A2I2KLK9_9ACTN|nr:ATP-binding cassette domain-containing protein [Frankia canadensis]SNQ46555.1 ABC-type branched-chain amino acid transport system, ATPase component [Frankia canadensis]SOU53845.1 ABC-type branched-chain amino acid transport system, ATPase component [Frankia canadensis]
MTVVLSVDMLSAGQGRTRIVEDVSFTLAAGTVTGLIGPNGAGKTTLIDALTGFATIFAGSVSLDGVSLADLPAHARQRHGLARTFQGLELFDSLDVAENLAVVARPARAPGHLAAPGSGAATGQGTTATVGGAGPRRRGGRHGAVPVRAGSADAEKWGLEPVARRLPATLTHDERAAVALGRALSGTPKVLLLDEPAAGLDPADRHGLAGRIRQIAGRGVAVLLVDHDVRLVFDVCDQVLVLDSGRIVARGRPAQVRADPAVRAAYLGEPADGTAPTQSDVPVKGTGGAARPVRAQAEIRVPRPASGEQTTQSTGAGAELLVLDRVTSGYHEGPVLREVSLTVRAGEIVALLGANGAGKTTLIRTAAGQLPVTAGKVTLLGERSRRAGPSALARRGLAVVPQGRGALARLTVRENLSLAAGRRSRDEIDQVLGWFPPLRDLLDRTAGELSGGERQRLALAVALVRRPRLLLVDELSFGLAPGVAPRLLNLLRGIAAETSTGVLLVEQFAAIALRVADRGYVLDRGRIALSASAADLAARPDLVEASYLGETTPPPDERPSP